MIVRRKSELTGAMRERELPVTEQQILDWQSSGGLVQDHFPWLSDSEREFLMTGVTDDEWAAAFPQDVPAIINDRQAAVTEEWIQKFEHSLGALRTELVLVDRRTSDESEALRHARILQIQIEAVESQLETLRSELAAYRNARSGS